MTDVVWSWVFGVCSVPFRQLLVLHAMCCSRGPRQVEPPGSGSCKMVFLRSDTPPPQEALQSVQDDHSLTTQPAIRTNTINLISSHTWKPRERRTEEQPHLYLYFQTHLLFVFFSHMLSPGQGDREQVWFWTVSSQAAPPATGLQVRLRVRSPDPHDTEHSLHAPHGPYTGHTRSEHSSDPLTHELQEQEEKSNLCSVDALMHGCEQWGRKDYERNTLP